jgi:hypothetical protein
LATSSAIFSLCSTSAAASVAIARTSPSSLLSLSSSLAATSSSPLGSAGAPPASGAPLSSASICVTILQTTVVSASFTLIFAVSLFVFRNCSAATARSAVGTPSRSVTCAAALSSRL